MNNAKERIFTNPQFKLIDENAKWLKKSRDDKTVYLSYEDYKNDILKREEESKKFEPINDYESDLNFISPKYELAKVKTDSIFAKKREIWHKNLKEDIYVEESITVLSELKMSKNNLLVKN